jgi:GNAT superfamily N-acetyltransferase
VSIPTDMTFTALADDDQRAVLRDEHLAQLTAPLDDMWFAFAEMADAHALRFDAELAGSCHVDAEGRLLRLHLRPRWLPRAGDVLREAIAQLDVTELLVFTYDPVGLSAALDLAWSVEPHSLDFQLACAPSVEPLELAHAGVDELAEIVAFQVESLGAPAEWLEGYSAPRLERGEFWTQRRDGCLVAVGELRGDEHQAGVAHVGMVVHPSARRQGLAAGVLVRLIELCHDAGLAPRCSTEVSNVGARRAIERAGFRSSHRLLRVTPPAAP